MKNLILMFILLLTLPVKVSSQPNNATVNTQSGQPVSISSNPSVCQCSCLPTFTNSEGDAFLKHPEWWLVIIAAITGAIVGWQSWETRKSANASQRVGEHMTAADRAWLLESRVELTSGAKDAPEGVDQVFIQCAVKNHGRTVARVLGMNARWGWGSISDPSQTWDERLYDFDQDAKPRWVILPDKSTALHSPVSGFRANPGEKISVPVKPGEAEFIHGVIRYWDAFDETDRFTRFCYRWQDMDNLGNSGVQPAFYRTGSDRYNQQT